MLTKKITISELKLANPIYFEKGKKESHGDLAYHILQGKKSKTYFFVLTSQVGENSTLPKYRICPIHENGKLCKVLGGSFKHWSDVKDALKEL